MADRPPRTLLEQRIRQRCMTYEEFVQHAETFARDNREPGTLSLRQLLDAARRVDCSTITLLHQQLDAIRRLDRQLGAIVARDELNAKISQVQGLTAHSLAPGTREPLAALLSEMHTLAGWQALDLGDMTQA